MRFRGPNWSSPEMGREALFIVGHGRDGSTLLQHLINASADGADIRGENLVGLQLASIIGTLMSEKHFNLGNPRQPLESKHPWYGADQIDKQRVMKTCAELFKNEVISRSQGTKLVGFKEVRWFDLPHAFSAVRWIYPNARFLFLERDPNLMAQSGWWGDTENAVERIVERQELAREVRQDLGPCALTLSFESILNVDSTRQEVEEFLRHKLNSRSWQAVLSEPLSHPGGRAPWQLVRGQAT